MRDALIQRYAGLSVPRYTSYPTAAEFTAAVGPAEHARWLETLDSREPVSLYLHVPYCHEICHYCGCATKMVTRDHVLASYRGTLQTEIERAGRHLTRPPRVSRLHWGGGTPALLTPEGLGAVLETLADHCNFDPGFEHAIELDPRGVTPDLARSLVRLGVNRVSLGVQDLDPEVQAAIGRVQSPKIVGAAFDALRQAGIPRVNVDLIYGLPKQTAASVTATARQVVALDPDRIACYGYAHLPERKRNQSRIDASALPDAFARFAQAEAIGATFSEAGYEAVGIDHFARPGDPLAVAAREGRLSRNFQGYTDDRCIVLLGFGASAISRLESGFAQTIADPTAYAQAVGRGQMPTARGYRLSDEDRIRGSIIEQLMCAFRVDLNGFGPEIRFSDELALLRPLVSDGVVTHAKGVLAMTAVGRPFVRVVASLFDGHRQGSAHNFSLAV